ncbi:MAG: hypothetical protein ACK55J_06880, partial [Alphaproteobacteria bacterium]
CLLFTASCRSQAENTLIPDVQIPRASSDYKHSNENSVGKMLRHRSATPTATRRSFAHRHLKPHNKPDAGVWRVIISAKRIHGGEYVAIA